MARILTKLLIQLAHWLLTILVWHYVAIKLLSASCKTEAVLKSGFLLLYSIVIIIKLAHAAAHLGLVDSISKHHEATIHNNRFLNGLFCGHD